MFEHGSAPIDLTDLATFARADTRPRRAVFCGRVSTKDQQNPASSVPRQVDLASRCLSEGEEFTGYFWDVESGMLPPEARGLGPQEMYESLHVPTPRTGGLQDLLDRVELMGITHVMAERSDRIARAMLTSLTVEHHLDQAGVEVVYANEPTGGTESGRLRARRYGQVESEVYRTVLMEMSTGGQIQHALGGWNHGYPPYPYMAVVDENAPARGRARFGEVRPKKKLVPHSDRRRFEAAAELCRLRREEHLWASGIRAVLSAEPDRYPIEGKWTHGLIEGLIANPKLTGYQVYNRRASRTARKGQSLWNPISEWVWSPRPVHEAVVTLEEWKEAQAVTASLRAGTNAGPLARIRAAALNRGLKVSVVEKTSGHTRYQIGSRMVVLPTPIPHAVAQQVIEELENAA